MNVILLSGGSGKRLWPLSNEIRSKQFIKMFRKPDQAAQTGTGGGAYESMVQRVYRQLRAADRDAVVTVATSKSQVSAIFSQLGPEVGISAEPCRRDTFPAIALACASLHEVRGVSPDEAVVICPVDPFVEGDYFAALRRLWQYARDGAARLLLLGIAPAYPSEKYGYILPASADELAPVRRFQEKPDRETALRYIREGGLWNGGVFACRLSYILERAHQLIDFTGHADLLAKYGTLDRISFDRAVAEHERDLSVLRFSGQWKDLGTWNTLTEAMDESAVGNVRLSGRCVNVHAVNELGIPILAVGLRDVVISASPEGILVADKKESSYIKPLIDEMDRQVMFAEKSWGSFRVLDVEKNSLTIKVTLSPHHRMNYHSHDRRDEVWTVVQGSGRAVLDGKERPVAAGDIVTIAAGCRHTVIAETLLCLIEVQIGTDISVSDKHKHPLDGVPPQDGSGGGEPSAGPAGAG